MVLVMRYRAGATKTTPSPVVSATPIDRGLDCSGVVGCAVSDRAEGTGAEIDGVGIVRAHEVDGLGGGCCDGSEEQQDSDEEGHRVDSA